MFSVAFWLAFFLLLDATLTTGEPCLTLSIPKHAKSHSFSSHVLCGRSNPIYTWTSAEYSSEINSLLSGEEVTLPAPIEGSPYANRYQVIWLKEIWVNFDDKKDPSPIKKDLTDQEIEIEMTHSGTFTFQLGGKNYVVNYPEVGFDFKAFPGTELERGSNVAYENLQRANMAISPFTTWKIRLTQNDDAVKTLEKYKGQDIDLQFCGKINYFTEQGLDGFKEVEGDKDRVCYCEYWLDSRCAEPLYCFTCSEESCHLKECGLLRTDRYAKDNTVDCYVNYDNTGSEPKVEAGCKDFGKAAGPEDTICGRETQQDWVGSKERKSCRCTKSYCNGGLEKLVAEGVQVIGQETTTIADGSDDGPERKDKHPHKRPRGNAGESLKMSWAGLVAFMGAVLCIF